jgi:hypothetical protein
MEPLYDQTGQVHRWINRPIGRIVNLSGQHMAFVEDGNVYNWNGQHIGWWQERHLRNHAGEVALFLRNASSFGLTRPILDTTPRQPVAEAIPPQPVRAPAPTRSPRQLAWAQVMPF